MRGRVGVWLIGGLGGALLGLLGAWLYLRMARPGRQSPSDSPRVADVVRLVLSIVGVLRQIVALGR